MVRVGGLAAFGEDLRRAREQRGVTVDGVCHVTKLAVRHVRAMEAGNLAELPGGVFRRGFLRSYLHALGLDERLWMERFEQSCRESGVADPAGTDWMAFAENVKNNRAILVPRGGKRRAGIGVVVAVAVLAIWFGWRLANHHRLLPMPLSRISANSSVDNATSR